MWRPHDKEEAILYAIMVIVAILAVVFIVMVIMNPGSCKHAMPVVAGKVIIMECLD